MKKLFEGICLIGIVAFIVLLSSCADAKHGLRPQKGETSIEDIRNSVDNAIVGNRNMAKRYASRLPSNIDDTLLSGASDKMRKQVVEDEDRFNISVKNEAPETFFMGLIKGTDYNIVVSPKINGTISLDLQNVTIPEVLAALRDAYGYDYQRTEYGYKVFPAELDTKIFNVDYLDVIRNGRSGTVISSGQISGREEGQSSIATLGGTSTSRSRSENSVNASIVETQTQSDFWKILRDTLFTMVGNEDGKKVIVNPAAGTVVVHAYPSELKAVGKYLKDIQKTMEREVIIDTKVLEVTLNKEYEQGIDWDALGVSQDSISNTFSDAESSTFLKTFTQIFTLKAANNATRRYNLLVHLLSLQGTVQVLSSPRIATVNNQKAVIKVGTDEFFVTDISGSTVNSSGGTDTQQDVDLTPFFSGIALDVTPQIDENNNIILHIHPIVSTVTDQTKSFTTNGKAQSDIPLAFSTIRESDSIVRARNGQIIVIGGLMENKTKEKIAGTPFLDKLPFLGTIFRRHEQTSVKTELVILLRPIIVDDASLEDRLKLISNRYRSLDEGFHFASHQKTFGNLAETDGLRGS